MNLNKLILCCCPFGAQRKTPYKLMLSNSLSHTKCLSLEKVILNIFVNYGEKSQILIHMHFHLIISVAVTVTWVTHLHTAWTAERRWNLVQKDWDRSIIDMDVQVSVKCCNKEHFLWKMSLARCFQHLCNHILFEPKSNRIRLDSPLLVGASYLGLNW